MNVAGSNRKLIPELSFLEISRTPQSLNQQHSVNQPNTKISVKDINRCLKFQKGNSVLKIESLHCKVETPKKEKSFDLQKVNGLRNSRCRDDP